MPLKTFNPVTPTTRNTVLVDKSQLHKGRPVKKLTHGLTKSGGRNNLGRTTVFTKSGGHRRLYRIIDFNRNKFDVEAIVKTIEYDPNRSSFIALIEYTDKVLSYIIAPQRLSVGDKVISSKDADIKPGNTLPLANIPIGTIIHNVELKPEKGGQIARSAGSYAQLVGKDSGHALIRLRSGEVRRVNIKCLATIGAVSNQDHQNRKIGKAGRNRWLGVKPTVRGVAMNPVDHPHGGGEGRTSGGRHPVTPWGKPTKGKKTRKNNKTSNNDIIRSRHTNKNR